MVTTVTTTTVTTVAVLGLSGALSGGVVAALMLLLVKRELASFGGVRLQPLAQNLAIATASLLTAFLAIAGNRLGLFL